MGDIKGFLKIKRKIAPYRPVLERVKDYRQVNILPVVEHSKEQASRCMDCGTPFCHWGCPIANYIPEWNDLLFHGKLEKAYQLLSAVNNFPEITGRICPSLCEYACVLGINDEPITIRENELTIIEQAFKYNLIKASPLKKRTGKRVAVIGSGPAGLACADQLNKMGHTVVVFERDDKAGGILRYGIPDFKLEKGLLDRRLKILKAEGIEFRTGICAGVNYKVSKLRKDFDCLCLAGGSSVARDLEVEGRGLSGIYFAMDYLTMSNKRISGEKIFWDEIIDAQNKKVVVIGGGDTGSDCVGTAHRQGAKSIIQIEILPKPPQYRSSDYPWPKYPVILKTSSSHEEGGERIWSVLTKKFSGENGQVKKLSCVRVEFTPLETIGQQEKSKMSLTGSIKDSRGKIVMKEVLGSEFELEADLVILALGFLYPQKEGLIKELALELDARGNVKTGDNFMTSKKGVFCCGDMRRGQSLVVWAISEGRKCADYIDKFFT